MALPSERYTGRVLTLSMNFTLVCSGRLDTIGEAYSSSKSAFERRDGAWVCRSLMSVGCGCREISNGRTGAMIRIAVDAEKRERVRDKRGYFVYRSEFVRVLYEWIELSNETILYA